MNRRKPRVVIPRNVDELMSLGSRVVNTIAGGSSIVQDNPSLGPMLVRLVNSMGEAEGIIPEIIVVNERAQTAIAQRDEAFSQLRDRLIQIRDLAVARSGGQRGAAGSVGFEVVQSTSSSGVARVVIPGNPEQFLALSKRVFDIVSSSGDAQFAALGDEVMDELISDATGLNNDAVTSRERWQLLVSQRRGLLVTVTESLRQLRDLAFAVAGPRNYEQVSTLGFVVQSDATQNGTGSSSSFGSGDSSGAGDDSGSSSDPVE